MIELCISGALGRMGKTIANLVLSDPEVKIVSVIEHPNHFAVGRDYGIFIQDQSLGVIVDSDIEKAISKANIVIDFSIPENSIQLLKKCIEFQKPIVIGTTGFNQDQKKEIQNASTKIPVLQSPNMSLGVNVLFYIVEKIAPLLKNYFEVEITEIHHSKKKDSPSGTALQLKNIIQDIYELEESNIVYGREGIVGERPKNQLGIHSIRGGDVVGEHTVYFFSSGERLEISHKATSREIFAKGAIIASKWLINKSKGFYTMKDVLGI